MKVSIFPYTDRNYSTNNHEGEQAKTVVTTR